MEELVAKALLTSIDGICVKVLTLIVGYSVGAKVEGIREGIEVVEGAVEGRHEGIYVGN